MIAAARVGQNTEWSLWYVATSVQIIVTEFDLAMTYGRPVNPEKRISAPDGDRDHLRPADKVCFVADTHPIRMIPHPIGQLLPLIFN